MGWQALALLQVFFSSADELLRRRVASAKQLSAFSNATLSFLLGVLPLATIYVAISGDFDPNFDSSAWFYLILQAIAISSAVILIFKAAETTDAANLSVIVMLRAVVASFVGYLFLGAVFEPQQVAGMILVIIAAFIVSRPDSIGIKMHRGTAYALIGSMIYGVGLLLEKEAIDLTGLQTYMIIGWGLQGLMFLILSWKHLLNERPNAIKQALPSLLLLGVMIFMSGALYVAALDKVDNTGILLAFINLKTILVVLGGVVFLGERSRLGIKLIGGALAVVGVTLLVV